MARARRQPEILISGGDPTGVGPECIQEIWPEIIENRYPIRYYCTAGKDHVEAALEAARRAGQSFKLVERQCDDSEGKVRMESQHTDLQIISLKTRKSATASGSLAFHALRQACQYAKQVPIRGLLTLPLSKASIIRSGQKNFNGHTGYLKEFFHQKEVLMLMYGQEFSVIPLTEHIPLAAVPEAILSRMQRPTLLPLLLQLASARAFKGKRMLFCGLNPHAGEGGLIGQEERKIEPILKRWQRAGLPVEGPVSADAAFTARMRQLYPLILACYHDQGLVPFKALEGRFGVNVTLGLPFLRTSPDHGPAFDIAGKGLASADSTRRAWQLLSQEQALWN